jgi:UDP-N-acetylglucosamine/UDP-N-acetylgalactosamine diphosphorylase
MSIDDLLNRYEAAGQGHLLKFWSSLSPADQKSFAAQLETLDIERVNRIYKKATTEESAMSDPNAQIETIEPILKDATDSVVGNPEKEQEWRRIGLDAISRGQVGVLLLAGGQGTRLGSNAPKGCYDIGLPSHKSLFQYQAERIARLQRVAEQGNKKPAGSVIIPWYIMTSGPTRRDTEDFFKKNTYFGLNTANVIFFEQGKVFGNCF